LYSIEIKHLREFTLFQNDDVFISHPGSFFVTEDDMVFVFDEKASNIKIFNTNGKLVKIFGKRGLGPDEFIKPFFSAYKKPLVAFVDFRRNFFFIYERIANNNLKFKKKFLFSGNMAYNFQFLNDKELLIAGDNMDKKGKWYNLYIYNYEKNEYEFLLPLETSYGYNSIRTFRSAQNNKLSYIGLFQYCDWIDNRIYLIWTAGMNIIKINRKTKGMKSFSFKKTERYVQPYLTPEIKKAYDERKPMLIYKLKNEMSYIKCLFVVNSKKIGLVYVGPLKKNKGVNVMIQIYHSSGECIKEFEILNAKASTSYELYFYFRKDKNLFYVMDTETSEEFDQVFKIHEYRIEE
jgi:hypothetical protein